MTLKKGTTNPSILKILIADDVTTNRALAAKVLSRKGHQVVEVKNGLQAYEAFLNEIFDVILMDIQMPVMDGLEATRRIRSWENTSTKSNHGKRKTPTPIIALTANDEESARENYKQAGMNAVIIKPLDIKTVLPIIRSIIGEGPSKP